MSLPALLMMGEEPGSFRHSTLVNRCPGIIKGIISDNEIDSDTVKLLEKLAQDLAEGGLIPEVSEKMKNLYDYSSMKNYIGKSWLDGPWLHAECYLYHVVSDLLNFIDTKKDHFMANKIKSEISTDHPSVVKLVSVTTIEEALKASLWGNRADLSLFKPDDTSRLQAGAESSIIVNNSDVVVKKLMISKNVHIIADNYGFEILCDLVLSDLLISSDDSRVVTIHCKDMPYFVSDTSVCDIKRMISNYLKTDLTINLRNRLLAALESGRLVLRDDPFWASPSDFRSLPENITKMLSESDLTFLKGDLNYRKLVSDRHWLRSTLFEEVVSYFPSPLCALRTNKSEVCVGIPEDVQKALTASDPKWDVNGEFGVIQARL